jgi:hypothetical protein
MTAGEFLKKYYPQNPKKMNSLLYGHQTADFWLKNFIKTYNTYKPHSAIKYNEVKGIGTPTWKTIAKMYGLTKWNELLDLCELDKNFTNRRVKNKFSVTTLL